jgi:class 3 adenylate cyclase
VMRQHDVVGHVVNVAARVAESARGGEVLATGVRDAVGSRPACPSAECGTGRSRASPSRSRSTRFAASRRLNP